MSLTTANLLDIIKKQYFFKLKANIDSFSALIWIQLLGVLFSLGGVGSVGSFSDYLHVEVKYYSANLVIAFTMIWAFVTAITITTKPYRNHDFSFVTNRLSSSIANILFLLTASIIGGATAMLASNLLKIIAYFLFNEQLFTIQSGGGEFAIGIGVTVLYLFCISALGYFIGTTVQISKLFIFVFPALFFGSVFIEAAVEGEFLNKFFKFYFFEPSILLCIVKIVVTTSLLFLAAISILQRMEVRK